jgi:uncharacterized protein
VTGALRIPGPFLGGQRGGRSRARLVMAGVLLMGVAWAAEVIPPRPTRYFNDYAGVVRKETAEQLNRTLEAFERSTSSQIVVAIFPRMQSDSSVEDYTVRVAQSWGVGQKGQKNGAVLFVFVQDRQVYLQVGYGLEGAIPDATAKTIIDQEITPRFRAGDFDGGLTAGVNAILQAARGEYTGTGRTVAEGKGGRGGGIPVLLLLVALILLVGATRRSRGTIYRGSGRSGWGGWGGGSSGGGFSGGGGSFGGGGAGGRW